MSAFRQVSCVNEVTEPAVWTKGLEAQCHSLAVNRRTRLFTRLVLFVGTEGDALERLTVQVFHYSKRLARALHTSLQTL